MALDIADVLRRTFCHRHRFGHRSRLSRDARCGVAHFPGTIVVDGRSPDHGIDIIAIGHRGGELLEQDHPDSAPENGALRLRIESAAMSVGR